MRKEEAAVTEITFHTEERDGAQLFFVSESLGGKSSTHTRVMQTHPCNAHTHTHTLTFQTEHGSSLLPTRNKCRLLPLLFLLTLSRVSSSFHSFSSPFLYTARPKRSRTDTRILTHTLLSPVASLAISLPLFSPLAHMHTL